MLNGGEYFRADNPNPTGWTTDVAGWEGLSSEAGQNESSASREHLQALEKSKANEGFKSYINEEAAGALQTAINEIPNITSSQNPDNMV